MKRALAVLIIVLLAIPAVGLGKRRKRGRKAKKRVRTPAAKVKVRGKVRRNSRRRVPTKDRDRKGPGGADKDPRLDNPGGASGGPVGGGNPTLQRGQRLEFDGRLVQGQTARSGAVYLFERARSELRSMVRERTSYRDEIVRTVFPSRRIKGGKR